MEIEPVYIKCPECGKWYSYGKLLSYTVFDTDCWSDGKCVDGSMTEYSFLQFSRCKSCHSFFWFDDCQNFPEYELNNYFEANLVERHKQKLVKDFLSQYPNYQEKSTHDFELEYPYEHYWENLPKFFIKDFIHLINNKIL